MAVSDQPLLDHRPRHLVEAVRAVLRSHLDDALALRRDAHDLLRLLHRVGERLLHVDMLPGGQRVQQHPMVKVFGRRDDDRVKRLVGEQLLVVDEGFRSILAQRRHHILALREVARVGVADRVHLDPRSHPGISPLSQVAAAASGSDDADVNAIIRSQRR